MSHAGPARYRFPWPLGFALCCLAIGVLILLPSMRSILHESDQAALLRGAWLLASGQESLLHPDLYNYDRLFLTYWLVAAVLRGSRLVVVQPDVVLIGNVFSASFFSAVAWWLVWRERRRLHFGLVFGALLSPAIVLHAPYLAASTLSGAFLLWLFISLSAHRPAAWGWAAVLSFAAVGCRADAVLVLPGLCWLTLWPPGSPWRFFGRARLYAAMGGAVAALLTGNLIRLSAGPVSLPPVFAPKVFAAYSVFGLGAVMILLLSLTGWLGSSAWSSHGRRRWSYVAGAVMLWIPFGYYAPHMLSTRYWMTCVLLVLMALCSRRFQAWWKLAEHRPSRGRHWLVGATVACATLPFFVGISLPTLTHPRLCLIHATTFPSADGDLPMGALLDFDFGSARLVPDHNQAIWLASLQADFRPSSDGAVPVLNSPMVEVLELACLVRGFSPRRVDSFDAENPVAFSDVRSLIKAGGWYVTTSADDLTLLSRCALTEASPFVDGTSIVSLDSRASAGPGNAIWQSAVTLFRGMDFRLFQVPAGETASFPPRWRDGKSIAVFARKAFQVAGVQRDGSIRHWTASSSADPQGYHGLMLSGASLLDVVSLRFEGAPPSEPGTSIAQSVLPDYMNPQAFQ